MSHDTQNEATLALLAMVGQDVGDVERVLHRYGAIAASPDMRAATRILRAAAKKDALYDHHTWGVIQERGKDLALVVLVVHQISHHYQGNGRYMASRRITVGVGLSPQHGRITPGRAWRELRPWRKTGDRAQWKIAKWAHRDEPDRVHLDAQYFGRILAVLEGTSAGRPDDCE